MTYARRLVLIVAVLALVGCEGRPVPSASPSPSTTEPVRVLLFTRTEAFRHDAIPDAVAAVRRLAEARGLTVDATEDAAVFADAALSPYAGVVFLLTSGNVLTDEQQAAFERYIQAGGGYAGVHSASDTEYEWAWYGRLVGAFFKDHPPVQSGEVLLEDGTHPATRGLPTHWKRSDEWYNFRTNPSASVHVLLRLDESSYRGGTMGDDHPWSWCHEFDGGRSWYTAGGHPREAYADERFLDHLMGGIAWAAGVAEADCSS